MKVLHTSDWHLGRALYGRKRHEEFAQFLDWLAETIVRERVDVLLIAGDVFDTSTPGNQAQALYYRFLHRVATWSGSPCRHIVVVAGNHDSPTFLDAPAELLAALNVHVIGQAKAEVADEVLVLHDAQGQPGLIVCAVPYLRERDLRTAEPGESLQEKERKLRQGLRAHYDAVAQRAQALRTQLEPQAGRAIPIVATGHLFAEGAREGEGVRDLYVGNLGRIDVSVFPAAFDYVALGHLHLPQAVGGAPTIRYSGAPLAMGFGEAGQSKSVCLVQWGNRHQPDAIALLPVPVFQPLVRIQGDWEAIEAQLAPWLEPFRQKERQGQGGGPLRAAWLEVEYTGEAVLPDLRERLHAAVAGTPLEIVRIKNSRLAAQTLAHNAQVLEQEQLDAHAIFECCLQAHAVADAQRPVLRQAYAEILREIEQQDPRAQQ